MIAAVVTLAVAVAGSVAGLVYFGRAALSRADKITANAEVARAAIDEVQGQLDVAEAKRVAAETTLERERTANEKTTDDPILEKWFGAALTMLNPASARIVTDGLATDRRVHENRHGDANDSGGGTVHVPEAAPTPIATELP
jgi:hypothetical protein